MEKFVLGIFQEQLSKFIVGFHKEQVNANLLNGKGEIKDVSLHCDFLNEKISHITPYIELESVHVSRLSFHVQSWTNLKKAPILIDIEDVTAKVVEPLHYVDRSLRRTLRQITKQEFEQMFGKRPRGAYNIFDRILDNIQLEVRSVTLTFQPRGRFKTRRVGPWTPPRLVAIMRHLRYCSVNEFGSEGTPEECWRHNDFNVPASERTLLIFKRMTMEFSFGIQPTSHTLRDIMRPARVQVHIAFHKRFRDGAFLAVQADVTLNRIELQIDHDLVRELVHFLAGMQYCLGKNKGFDDPLLPSTSKPEKKTETTPQVVEEATEVGDLEEDDDAETNSNSQTPSEHDKIADDFQEVPSDLIESDPEDDDMEPPEEDAATTPDKPTSSTARTRATADDRPLLMFPSGIVLHERLSLSLSVNDCKVRGAYGDSEDGYIQCIVKGMVAEAMWPKVMGEKGGYLQSSISYFSIEERFGTRIRPILVGGIQHDINPGGVENPTIPKVEIPRDEYFPLFEDRCIRRDPLDLRHCFPAQAVGSKVTVDFLPKLANPEESEIMVLLEVGLDRIETVMDMESWCRALRFALNEKGGGFDARWVTGDWSEELTVDMLVDPSQPLNLEEHLQHKRQVFLDENYMISSDLLNVTARTSNVSLRIPAAVQKDIRSCDVLVDVGDVMLIVSSALPRTFLTGKIGLSVYGDGSPDRKVDFPNDRSDVCYALENAEDPSIRQLGTMTSKKISTFRCQLTTRGFNVRIVPVIPFCDAPQSQELLPPIETTMLFCFEGEPPETEESNLIKLAFFLSVQVHKLVVNLDFDTLTGAISTALYHSDLVESTIKSLTKTFAQSLKSLDLGPETKNEGETRLKSTIRGRRVLVKRQIARSRETGGISFAFCSQIAEFHFNIWRQNVPIASRFRMSMMEKGDETVEDDPIPLIQLLRLKVADIEAGVEGSLQGRRRRVVLKCHVADTSIELCDFDSECDRFRAAQTSEGAKEADNQEPLMVRLIEFGSASKPSEEASPKGGIIFRCEESMENKRSLSLSAEVLAGGIVNLHVHEIEMLFLLFVEALLMPTTAEAKSGPPGQRGNMEFPAGSIGHFLVSLLPEVAVEDSGLRDLIGKDGKVFQFDEGAIDKAMEKIVLDRLPENVTHLLFRLVLANVLLVVPHRPTKTANEIPWFALSLHDASILTAYLDSNGSKSKLMKVLAKRDRTWESLLPNAGEGIYHCFEARQSLHAADNQGAAPVITDTLVPAFDIVSSYQSSSVSFSMKDSTLSFQDLTNTKELRASLIAFINRCIVMKSRVESVVNAIARSTLPPVETKQEKTPVPATKRNVKGILVEQAESDYALSLRRSRAILGRLKVLIESHEYQMRKALTGRQSKVDSLRFEVFEKERWRLGALALVASQAAGWLRAGGIHMYGQRAPNTATLWLYYAVLRKSLLIFYDAPGKPKPLDVICLHGAVLRPLAGGRKKRDIKNGFAIVEKSGRTRFCIASDSSQFEMWIRESQGAIDNFAINESLQEQLDKVFGPASSNDGNAHFDPDENIEDGKGTRGKQYFKKLSSTVQAARQRVTRSGPGDDATTVTDVTLGATESVASDFALTELGDPNEIGSSMSMDSNTTEGMKSSNDEIAASNHGVSEQPDNEQMPRTELGKRFASMRSNAKNRFGSAVQGAREKAKAVAEERRRRRQETDLTDDASLDSQRQRLGGFRGRIGPLTPRKMKPDADPIPENLIVSVDSSEMSQQTGEVGMYAQTVDDDLRVEELDTDLEVNDSTRSARGAQLRNRVSQWGAAVKNATQAQSRDGDASSRFSVRRLTGANTAITSGGSIVLKNVRVGVGHPADGIERHALPMPEVALARLPGKWVVRVKAIWTNEAAGLATESSSTSPVITEDSQPVEGSGDSAANAEVVTETNDTKEIEQDTNVVEEFSGEEATSKSSKQLFQITIQSRAEEPSGQRGDFSVNRSLADTMALHTRISEAIAMVPTQAMKQEYEEPRADGQTRMADELAETLGMSPMDTVRLTGSLLGGLLAKANSTQQVSSMWAYHCEVLAEFLNSILSCGLPEEARDAVVAFLRLPNAGEADSEPSTSGEESEELWPEDNVSLTEFQEIVKLAAACHADLLRAEASHIMFTKSPRPNIDAGGGTSGGNSSNGHTAPVPFMDPLLPSTVSEGLREAMHTALMNVMTERDDAQAQLIASSVLHVHEMESERKKIELLQEKLRLEEEKAKQKPQRSSSRLFRSSSFVATKAKPVEGMDIAKYQEHMIQSTDAELIALCNQLAGEISAKTSANLEVIRLKESRKIEKQNDDEERRALETELRAAREKLRIEQIKVQEAQKEADRLKKLLAEKDTTD